MLSKAIFFIHRSPFPVYLWRAIESARFFNPDISIFLLCDNYKDIPTHFHKLSIEILEFQNLETSDHRRFIENYQHISGNPFEYERFCFSRWFYLSAAMEKFKINSALHLDSDCLLFDSFDALEEQLHPWKVALSEGGGPHCTYIKGSLKGLIDLINGRFADENYLAEKRKLMEQAAQENRRVFLCDMNILSEYVDNSSKAVDYTTLTLPKVIEQNMNLLQGFKGRRRSKRVYWKVYRGMLLPYLKRQVDGQLIPAYALHYKGGAKRRIKSFNPYVKQNKLSSIKASIRALLYNLSFS
ncbi:MAG: hypothetical protein ACQEP8_03025 [Chlamydiota bacterium]